jgi:hypothetical protein
MNILALSSLVCHVLVDVNLTAHGDLGEFGVDIEGEGAELADVNGSASTHLVIHVLDEGSPDDEHLMTCNGKIY